MSRPPLAQLRTFEAAVRHGSFSRAASELHVTPAAVSQQMRALEAQLGVQLFVRGARGLTVTRQGQDYANSIARALADVDAATRTLGRPEREGRLTVATFHSFASLWLLPRLGRFRARYPEIDVRLAVAPELVDPRRDEVDVAVRFGAGTYEGCDSRFLMDDTVLPVCAPSLIADRPMPRHPMELVELPLIHDDGIAAGERQLSWSDWLKGARPRRSLHLPDGLLALQAALLGQGVTLARRSTVIDHLRAGRLVRLLNEERRSVFSYWLVSAAGAQSPKLDAFVEWILAEVERSPS